ncbi:MAG: CoA transferase [Xanthomonadaceae bacterium]|nr:CoA transferase [Xanthomonadaceae bacterium]
MSAPLRGIRIIEVGHMLMGPYCGMLLADLGAEVIKVEPAGGDIARHIGLHEVEGHNCYFASLNRNKRSVVLDLADPAGQRALAALAADAHALVTNLRPSAIRKLGLTYDALREHNPRLVCVALTGFGLDSPHADQPAYDYVVQALTGIMQLTGEPGGPPVKTGYSAVDNSAGIMGAVGLLAKIVEGQGGQVDIAMYDVMLSQLNYLASSVLNGGETLRRLPMSSHPYIVPAQLFRTADDWLMLFITHDDFWRIFCERVQRPEWLLDARFATMRARRENREAVVEALAELFSGHGTAYWLELLCDSGLVVSGLQSLEQALCSEQARWRDMVVHIDLAQARLSLVGNPIRIDGSGGLHAPPPRLGEHTALYTAAARA